MITFLAVILGLLQGADYWTTVRGIKAGKAKEGNPVVKWFMEKFGLELGLGLTKVGGVAVAWFLWATESPWYAFGILIAVYAAVVVNNYKIIKD